MKNKLLIISVLFLFILVFKVNAFAVSASYWSDKPLIVKPGDTKQVALTLQNMAGEPEDVKAEAELISGNAIARIIDNSLIYDIPFGRDDVKVNLEIKVPETAQPGDKWTIKVKFRTIEEEDGGGAVRLSSGIVKYFDVIIQEPVTTQAVKETPEKGIGAGTNILLLVLLIGVLFFIFRYTRKKGGKK